MLKRKVNGLIALLIIISGTSVASEISTVTGVYHIFESVLQKDTYETTAQYNERVDNFFESQSDSVYWFRVEDREDSYYNADTRNLIIYTDRLDLESSIHDVHYSAYLDYQLPSRWIAFLNLGNPPLWDYVSGTLLITNPLDFSPPFPLYQISEGDDYYYGPVTIYEGLIDPAQAQSINENHAVIIGMTFTNHTDGTGVIFEGNYEEYFLVGELECILILDISTSPNTLFWRQDRPEESVIPSDYESTSVTCRFSKTEDIITDSTTGLEWIVGPDEDITWYEAEDWVNALGGNWRMPSRSELQCLIGNGIDTLPEGFFENSGDAVWSAEATLRVSAWFVRQYNGRTHNNPRSRSYMNARAFAVRSPE